ncbi:hypothetical protein HAX54_049979, partial [Datura stramonium]|nr:hypothetical protein [Datura stramonium]
GLDIACFASDIGVRIVPMVSSYQPRVAPLDKLPGFLGIVCRMELPQAWLCDECVENRKGSKGPEVLTLRSLMTMGIVCDPRARCNKDKGARGLERSGVVYCQSNMLN